MNHELLRRKAMEIMSRHRGPENAIKTDELVFQLSIWDADLHAIYAKNKENADRAVRRIYSNLPIAASSNGLYIPRTPKELEAFRNYMQRAYGNERAAARVKIILAYYQNLRPTAEVQRELF